MGLLSSVDACMPRHTGIRARPSRIYAASTDKDRSTSPISRHAYGRTATAHNPSMDRTALPAQPRQHAERLRSRRIRVGARLTSLRAVAEQAF